MIFFQCFISEKKRLDRTFRIKANAQETNFRLLAIIKRLCIHLQLSPGVDQSAARFKYNQIHLNKFES